MSDESRRVVPREEALRRIGDGEWIHAFRGGGLTLVGCDYPRAKIVRLIEEHGCEEAGPVACALGHSLALRGMRLFLEAHCSGNGREPEAD